MDENDSKKTNQLSVFVYPARVWMACPPFPCPNNIQIFKTRKKKSEKSIPFRVQTADLSAHGALRSTYIHPRGHKRHVDKRRNEAIFFYF